MSRATGLLACAALLAACGSSGGIFVRIDATPPVSGVAALRCTLSIGDTVKAFTIRPDTPISVPPQQTFLMDLPPTVQGLYALRIDALDGADGVLATGSASGDLADGRITVVLGATIEAPDDGGVDLAVPDEAGGDLAAADLAGSDLARPPCPTVLLAVDYSGSTASTIAGSTTEYAFETQALSLIASRYESRVKVGLATLGTAGGACGDGVSVAVAPALGTAAQISSAMAGLTPNGFGNLDTLLNTILADATFLSSPTPTVVVVTDGSADCPGAADSTAVQAAVSAAQTLVSNGARVLVIGMAPASSSIPLSGTPNVQAALDQIAAAGGAPCVGCAHSYYAVSGTSAFGSNLEAQLQQLLDPLTVGCP